MTADIRKHAETIVGIYRDHAHAFDRLRSRALFEAAWLDRFMAEVDEPRTVLDLGCGMGEPIADHLSRCGAALVGVDTSAALLTLARRRLPNHEFAEADMRGLDLRRTFDSIIAWDSFFLLTPDDQRALFAVFERHARRGTALLFTSGPSASEVLGTFAGHPLYAASLDPMEYRALLAAHGFDVVRHVAEDPDCDRHTVWLCRYRKPG